MIILGVDPGSVVTGYGFICSQGNRLRAVDYGAFRLKKHADPHPARLWYLHEKLDGLIEQHRPHAISLEKVFHGVNSKSALVLGQVRGVVMALAAKHGLIFHEYSATEVKKTVTGYGRAEKAQIQEMVRVLLGLPEIPKPHDVADALANAICCAHMSSLASRIHA